MNYVCDIYHTTKLYCIIMNCLTCMTISTTGSLNVDANITADFWRLKKLIFCEYFCVTCCNCSCPRSLAHHRLKLALFCSLFCKLLGPISYFRFLHFELGLKTDINFSLVFKQLTDYYQKKFSNAIADLHIKLMLIFLQTC